MWISENSDFSEMNENCSHGSCCGWPQMRRSAVYLSSWAEKSVALSLHSPEPWGKVPLG